MRGAKQNLSIWRDVLEENADTLWNGMQEEVAPPLRGSFKARRDGIAWRWVAIAAGITVVGVASWNLSLQRELSATQSLYLVAMLQTDSSVTRLTTLHRLERVKLSDAVVDELMALIKTSDDPNVQLAALDILLDTGALDDEERIRALLKDVRQNRKFIETAMRARTIRT
jgi:hypothetical protein